MLDGDLVGLASAAAPPRVAGRWRERRRGSHPRAAGRQAKRQSRPSAPEYARRVFGGRALHTMRASTSRWPRGRGRLRRHLADGLLGHPETWSAWWPPSAPPSRGTRRPPLDARREFYAPSTVSGCTPTRRSTSSAATAGTRPGAAAPSAPDPSIAVASDRGRPRGAAWSSARRPPQRPARSWPSLSGPSRTARSWPGGRRAPRAVAGPRPGRIIVLTDIEMPRMTGLELAAELARQDRSIRVIVLTTFGRPRGTCAGRWTPPQPATR